MFHRDPAVLHKSSFILTRCTATTSTRYQNTHAHSTTYTKINPYHGILSSQRQSGNRLLGESAKLTRGAVKRSLPLSSLPIIIISWPGYIPSRYTVGYGTVEKSTLCDVVPRAGAIMLLRKWQSTPKPKEERIIEYIKTANKLRFTFAQPVSFTG